MDTATQSPPIIEMTTEDAIQFLASHNIRLRSNVASDPWSSDSNLSNANRRGEAKKAPRRPSQGNLSPFGVISGKDDSNSGRPTTPNSNISAQDDPNLLSRTTSRRRSRSRSTSISASEISLQSSGGESVAKSRAHVISSSVSSGSSTRLPTEGRFQTRKLVTASSTRSVAPPDASSKEYPATMARRVGSDRDFLRSIAPLPLCPPDASSSNPRPNGGQRRLWSRLFGCLGSKRAEP